MDSEEIMEIVVYALLFYVLFMLFKKCQYRSVEGLISPSPKVRMIRPSPKVRKVPIRAPPTRISPSSRVPPSPSPRVPNSPSPTMVRKINTKKLAAKKLAAKKNATAGTKLNIFGKKVYI